MTTFVTIGNLKLQFRRLLIGVSAIADRLPGPVVVQCGHNQFVDERCRVVPFFGMDEFAELVESASVLIMHAGAGSVIHALQGGKTPIVMPRRAIYGEHVDDHQLEFARTLAASGRVILAQEVDNLGTAVECAIQYHKRRRSPSLNIAHYALEEKLQRYERAALNSKHRIAGG
jgi:UDP-N-acetylglucosamine transferase subunit ALG13